MDDVSHPDRVLPFLRQKGTPVSEPLLQVHAHVSAHPPFLLAAAQACVVNRPAYRTGA